MAGIDTVPLMALFVNVPAMAVLVYSTYKCGCSHDPSN